MEHADPEPIDSTAGSHLMYAMLIYKTTRTSTLIHERLARLADTSGTPEVRQTMRRSASRHVGERFEDPRYMTPLSTGSTIEVPLMCMCEEFKIHHRNDPRKILLRHMCSSSASGVRRCLCSVVMSRNAEQVFNGELTAASFTCFRGQLSGT